MTALKKLIAALALTLTTSAFAQAPAETKPPLVTIYGTLNVNLQYTQASDATAGSAADVSARTAVSIDSSNIGFRGSFAASPALNVVYQCETQASIDNVTDTRALCNRNSRIGLSGDWGTLFLGNWDTPFKSGTYGTKADDPFGNTDVFAFQGIMGSPGFNTRSNVWLGSNAAAFDLRASNSVAYWTPKFSGLSAKVQWGVNETRSAVGTVDPTLLSAAVNYDLAGLSLVASAEYHEDAYGLRQINSGDNTGNTASKDLAWRLAAGYELPVPGGALTVMGMFEQLLYKQDDAAGAGDLEDFDRMAWLLGAKFRTGNHELRARYSMAMDPNCTLADGTDCPDAATEDFGAAQYALGYAYHVAKSTQLYAFYTQILNDDAAQYTFSVGGAPGMGAGTPAGADPMALGVGIRYAF